MESSATSPGVSYTASKIRDEPGHSLLFSLGELETFGAEPTHLIDLLANLFKNLHPIRPNFFLSLPEGYFPQAYLSVKMVFDAILLLGSEAWIVWLRPKIS